jgi:hypothetical protein
MKLKDNNGIRYSGKRDRTTVLERCPVCGIEFKGGCHRRDHIGEHDLQEYIECSEE